MVHRCGFVALIGAPNAGKSTLLNQLVGEKVSIISHKVQTTRLSLRAIALIEESQVIFVDTPGIFSPKRALDRAMVKTAFDHALEADHVLVLVDARKGLTPEIQKILQKVQSIKPKISLVLNKIDLTQKSDLLRLSQNINADFHFDQTFMISAHNGSGLQKLKDAMAQAMPEGPWLYPDDQLAEVPQKILASEITREKLYARVHDELPYACHIETTSWQERADHSVRIEQTLYVEKEGQRKILLGAGGQTIKSIGQSARLEMKKAFDRPVHLFLFVKIKEKWSSNETMLKKMGFL